MNRINIYVPDELRQRMVARPMNWSKIAQRAFEDVLQKPEAGVQMLAVIRIGKQGQRQEVRP